MAKKIKILIVEDEEMLSTMYKVKFENEGYDVYAATNGAEGIELAAQNVPDLILLDIIMPKVDGFAVLKKLKENPKTKDVPVILLTNLGQDEDISRGKELGATGYLIKANNTPSEVVAKVKQYIKK
ncbi:MAG: response regulator [Candidatus Komeilibacteria bacterium]|nr:response regulator [Candidatus Komeilibacteria bacterium]